MIMIADNADISDITDIARIEKESFSDPWTREGLIAALMSDNSLFLAAREENGRIVGYIIGLFDGNRGFIDNIAVDKAHRRKGAGMLLLKSFEARLGENAESVTLEVRESNTAAAELYAKAGYKAAGIRKDFYSNPRENAVVMIKRLDGKDI